MDLKISSNGVAVLGKKSSYETKYKFLELIFIYLAAVFYFTFNMLFLTTNQTSSSMSTNLAEYSD